MLLLKPEREWIVLTFKEIVLPWLDNYIIKIPTSTVGSYVDSVIVHIGNRRIKIEYREKTLTCDSSDKVDKLCDSKW